jgi:hypothetical protein
MGREFEKKVKVCRSQADFERIFLPETYERREREKCMREPESFGIHLEKELARCIMVKKNKLR